MKSFIVILAVVALASSVSAKQDDHKLGNLIQFVGNSITKNLKEQNPEDLLPMIKDALLAAIQAGEDLNRQNPNLVRESQLIAVNVVDQLTEYAASNPQLFTEAYDRFEKDETIQHAIKFVLNKILEVLARAN